MWTVIALDPPTRSAVSLPQLTETYEQWRARLIDFADPSTTTEGGHSVG